jgi:hypothetical protein
MRTFIGKLRNEAVSNSDYTEINHVNDNIE